MLEERQIGRYRILQLLGRGGMGDVYLASAKGAAGFEKAVVVKFLRPQSGHNRNLLREAFIGVNLDHQNVVQVLDLSEEDGRYYLVMEYVHGYTLAHLIEDAAARREPLPLAVVLHPIRQIADALEYVHGLGQGIIHRDVSPSNILLGTDGRVKLSDFGVAALAGEAHGHELLAGKPAYLPPEAFRGASPDQAWDVYALGVSLWEALAARRPFQGDSLAKIRGEVLAGPPALSSLGRGYPRELEEVADRAIHPDPGARYRSAPELRAALAAACPPDLHDADRHRHHLRTYYASPAFVSRHGRLPETRELLRGRELTPPTLDMADANAPTISALRVPLRIGLSQAGGSGWARGEGERLAARVATALGRPAVPVVVADYRSLIDCLSSNVLDLAWMPPVAFVEAKRHGARALAVASRMGRTTYHSAIITRADAPIATIADLRGQSMAWVDRDSASGYLFAAAEIVRHLGRPEAVLGKEHFVGSHRAVCEAVANGWAAAGATYVILDDAGAVQTSGWHERLLERAAEIKVVTYTRPIPGDNVACRPGLDDTTATELTQVLVDLVKDEEGKAILYAVFRAEALVPDPGDIYEDVRETLELLKK